MQVGDLVSWNGKTCVVTEVYRSKVWRTDTMGRHVKWKDIDSEPFARILVGVGDLRGVPQVDLEVVSESR